MLSVLPIFHAFGLTIGLILPLVSGVRVFLYPSPLHYRVIPGLIRASQTTVFLGTETFLAGYARTADEGDFRSLRFIVAGAEPVRPATRQTYLEKFGARIHEGYGVTEASPALSFNTPEFSRDGSVGRLLPAIDARIEPVPGIAAGGRLVVRGPNVMMGYLHAGRPGAIDPPPDGWHDTGDIVEIDADGYLHIKGRARRFAKIGGEMISLAAVEALAADLWPDFQTAVAAVPDKRKGERLVMVTNNPSAQRAAFGAFARERGATELMVPAAIVVVPELPLLGAGKIDHPSLARLVAKMQPQDAAPG
jgi:acyl-[acyl-carrier-protein]-phospholipid O-acyltransferase/long-chain-fatty-acid--[acyl-carrier-protein] ligase